MTAVNYWYTMIYSCFFVFQLQKSGYMLANIRKWGCEYTGGKLMRALFLEGPRTLSIRETQIPEIAADEALIKVHSVGICGSDIEYFSHNRCGSFVPLAPLVLGHELSGEVVKTGTEVNNIAIGTRVAIDPSMPCRMCRFCRAGRHNLCENLRFIGTAATVPHLSGGFGEYVAIRGSNCIMIPENVSWSEAACLEPLSVAVHAVLRPRRIAGERVLITGGGAIGQFIALTCRFYGAAVIAMSDIQDFRRIFAVEQGADFGLNPADSDDIATVSEEIGGFDLIIDASGAGPAVKQNFHLINKGGTIVQVGTLSDDLELPFNIVMTKELTILGSFRYGDVYQKAMSMLASEQVDVKPLISAVFPFDNAVDAFNLASERGNAIKIQVTLNQ